MSGLRIVCLLAVCISTASCGGGGTSSQQPATVSDYTYTAPVARTDGWAVGAVADVGIDESLITTATRSMLDGSYIGIDSFLIVKNGILVHEVYKGQQASTRHDLRSATKSITSLMLGIAVDNGFVTDVSDPALPYVQGYPSFENWDHRKNAISVRNFLTMSSGLECDDWRSSAGNETNMYVRDDWVKFILDLPMINDPGTRFSYCTGGVVVLGAIIQDASGMRPDVFAIHHLFGPLGITNYEWEFTPSNRIDTGGHIRMTARDMAKLGQLVLQRGTWSGVQVISEQWIDESTAYFLTIDDDDDYGYLWWRREFGASHQAIYASGNGGQYIMAFPALDLVVVFNGRNYNSGLQYQPFEMLERFILPAVQ